MGKALRNYITHYQRQRMRPLRNAPPSLRLHVRVMKRVGRNPRIAQWGYYEERGEGGEYVGG